MIINGIMACCKNKGIGLNNKLPWQLKEDLARFKKMTIGNNNNCIIMGSDTWDGIKYLKGRDHLILSSKLNFEYKQVGNIIKTFNSIELILKYIEERKYDQSWVIGGSKVLKQFLELNLIDRLYLTFINEIYNCDVFLPKLPINYFKRSKELLTEKTVTNNDIYMIIFDQIKTGMKVMYDNDVWMIVKIHFENNPDIYFTIKNIEGREKQTVKERIELL